MNKKVLAIFVFGSIVSGDLWEGSDIDAFVVYEDSFDKIRDIYSEVLDIPIHMKILSKNKFLELYETNGEKGFVRNLLISSKLIYCNDDNIENVFNMAKYNLDEHLEIWNLVYLGNLIKSIGVSKKYLHNDRVFTAYEVLIRSLDNFAKLYLNLNSYTVSKDAVKMAMNLENEFNSIVKDLFEKGCNINNIKNTLDYIDEYLNANIMRASKTLLDYLYEQDTELSSNEIKNSVVFKDFNIKIENILSELYKRGLIQKSTRKIDLPFKEKLISENVYSYR